MASPAVWALGSVAVVSIVSLVGALSLTFGALKRHRVMMFLIALAAGTLLGDAALHLLPEAAHENGFTSQLGWFVLFGFLAMFGVEAILHRGHSHAEHLDEAVHGHIKPFGVLNLVGDALHNLLDGVIIAAAYLIDTTAGIATTIAVVAHEVPQELGDFAILVRSGMSHTKALLLNLASAGFAVLGAVVVLAVGLEPETLQSFALPLIAGAFIYIAAADLIPELHHHSKGKDVAVIVVGLLLGLLLMGLLLDLEAVLPLGEAGHNHG